MSFRTIDRSVAPLMLPKLLEEMRGYPERKPPMTTDDILKVLDWAAKNNVQRIRYDTVQGISVDFFQVPQASTDASQETQQETLSAQQILAMQKQQLEQLQRASAPERKRETDIDVVMNPGKDILFPPDNEP